MGLLLSDILEVSPWWHPLSPCYHVWDSFQDLHIRATEDPNLLQPGEAADPCKLRAIKHVKFHNRRDVILIRQVAQLMSARADPGIKSEGGRAAILNANSSDGLEAREILVHDSVKEGRPRGEGDPRARFCQGRRKVRRTLGCLNCGSRTRPALPGKGLGILELDHQLHQQAMVLVLDVPNTQPTRGFGETDFVPCNKAL